MPFNQSAAPRGSETILLVESDPETRKLAAFMLGKQGYTVLEARNRAEASALFNQRPGDVELLLLEVRRGSCQLAEEVK
jgi:two-component system cell cycle sensor histidine kinase/response regulator CckA